MVVSFHFLYRDAGAIELLSALFVYLFDFHFKVLVLIFCEHVPELVFEVVMVMIFLNFEGVSEGEVGVGFCDFIVF